MGLGASLLLVLSITLIVFTQFHQYLFIKINRSLSGLVINSVVIDATNQERQLLGLGELKINEALRKAAQDKADDMAQKGYFAHQSPDGKNPWYWIDQTGYTYKAAGENLAVNFDYSKDVVNAWMNSPTHRANIVKAKYQEIGIGIAEGFYQGRPTVFVVQMFGTPKGDLGFGNVSLASTENIVTASSSIITAKILGASFDGVYLYELIFSGKTRKIILIIVTILIVLVLLLSLLNPDSKTAVKISKIAFVSLAILLILYALLFFKGGGVESSFMEF
jgi:uncharacterized protein YkwD